MPKTWNSYEAKELLLYIPEPLISPRSVIENRPTKLQLGGAGERPICGEGTSSTPEPGTIRSRGRLDMRRREVRQNISYVRFPKSGSRRL